MDVADKHTGIFEGERGARSGREAAGREGRGVDDGSGDDIDAEVPDGADVS